jgi:hypothetical protein
VESIPEQILTAFMEYLYFAFDINCPEITYRKCFYVYEIYLPLLVLRFQNQCCKYSTSIYISIQIFDVFFHDPAYFMLCIILFCNKCFYEHMTNVWFKLLCMM